MTFKINRAQNTNHQIDEILRKSVLTRAEASIPKAAAPAHKDDNQRAEDANTAFALLAKNITERNKWYFQQNWDRIKPNVERNAHKTFADWRPWQNKLHNRLAILVGAGPSARKPENIKLLKEIADSGKYCIMAANRAFPFLEEAGIYPDFVVVVDRISPPVKRKTKVPVNLICTYETNAELTRQWIGDKYFVLGGSLDGEDQTTNAKLAIIGPIIQKRARAAGTEPQLVRMSSGGNVGTFMFIVAKGWFNAPLLLYLGNDYGTNNPQEAKNFIMRPMRNYRDRYSKRDYIQYAKWLEEQYALAFQGGQPDIAINSSLDGIFNLENYLPNILNIPFSEIQPILMQGADHTTPYLVEWRKKNPWTPITLSDE